MEDWESNFDLCARLQGMTMPRLEIWDVTALNTELDFLEDAFERRYSVEPIHVLDYASDDDIPVNSRELQGPTGCSSRLSNTSIAQGFL